MKKVIFTILNISGIIFSIVLLIKTSDYIIYQIIAIFGIGLISIVIPPEFSDFLLGFRFKDPQDLKPTKLHTASIKIAQYIITIGGWIGFFYYLFENKIV